MQKQERGAVDSRVDKILVLVIIRGSDNSIVQLASKFVDVGLMGQIDRWCNKSKAMKAVSYPKIVSMYNGNMGGVDLDDMLISLNRIEVKTRRCYIKVFWHMVDIANVNKCMPLIPKGLQTSRLAS